MLGMRSFANFAPRTHSKPVIAGLLLTIFSRHFHGRDLSSSTENLINLVQRLRSMVHEIVGRINGRYGTLTENPIHHLDRQLSFHEVCLLR